MFVAHVAVSAGSVARGAPASIENLGAAAGTSKSEGKRINDAGDVVGNVTVTGTGRTHAFVRRAGEATLDLGTLNGPTGTSQAQGINASGVMAGWSDAPSGSFGFERAITAAPGGSMQNLGVSAGSHSRAGAINAAGDVAGYIGFFVGPTLTESPFIRRASDGIVQVISLPPGATGASPQALNDSGQMVGHYGLPSASHAFAWSDTRGFEDLGTLGGISSLASDINNRGDMVGSSQVSSGTYRAWIRHGGETQMLELQTLTPDVASDALGLNEAGIIVGSSTVDDGSTHAMLWSRNGAPLDLDGWLDQMNPADGANWTLTSAGDINNSGMIVGTGRFDDGPAGLTNGTRAFVLDASSLVPEPSGAALLLIGAIVGVLRRR